MKMKVKVKIMSKYTTEVRFICETEYGLKESAGQTKVKDILKEVAPKIFDFDFPIFDENYRLALEIKILRHFYTREIGLETVGLWKLKLEDKMNEIMPYLNKFYSMYVQELNPLYNFNLTKTHSGNYDRQQGTSSNKSEVKSSEYQNTASTFNDASNSQQRLYSDTPQGQLSDVQDGKYLTNATLDDGKNNSEANSIGLGNNLDASTVEDIQLNSITDTDSYYQTVQGIDGRFIGEAWKSFTEGFVNVDKMLFHELEDLFMQLW